MASYSKADLKRPIPAIHRKNFIHLYFDIAWYGVLSGSAISFLAVYATRLGADALRLGLLNAAPAVVNLMLTLPAGRWLQHRPIDRSVFWTAAGQRLFYVVWVFLPWLLAPHLEIWALIGLTLLMSVPGTALAVGFNALFAAAVPPEWRGYVAGRRNALLALMFMATSLLCGWILTQMPFPQGYQVVFAIGVLGGLMSTVHLWFVRPLEVPEVPHAPVAVANGKHLGDLVSPRSGGLWGMRQSVGLRWLARRERPLLSLQPLRGAFGWVVGVLFAFHLAQYLALPLFPLYWVNRLQLTDAEISYGNAVFYAVVLVGSMQLAWLSQRFGHKSVLVVGVLVMSAYPALTAVTQNLTLFLVTSAVGGIAWSLVGGTIGNYLLERVPDGERPLHLAWYNLGLNAAILIGSLLAPALAGWSGLVPALLTAAVLRLFAGLAIWRWG